MIRLADFYNGSINHALSFTEGQFNIHGVSYWPANSVLGCKSCAGPPYGSRFRLKATLDISHFSPNAQIVLKALQQYGMFLSDASINGATLYADTDTTQDAAVLKAFAEIQTANIGMSAFEAVDEASFIVSQKSLEVNPQNGYQVLSNFAVLTATPLTVSTLNPIPVPVRLPIALGSQAPGSLPAAFVVAGTPSFDMQAWVGGSTALKPTWQLLSGVGAITQAGVYTPPAIVPAPTTAMLQAASPGGVSNVQMTVLPSNPDGSIRIDAGSTVPTKSSNGTKSWLADIGWTGAIDSLKSDFPAWKPASDPDANVYQTFHYLHGGDLLYSLGVPNGNYRVRMLFAAPYNSLHCAAPCTYDILNPAGTSPWGPFNLVVQGQVAAHNYDMGIATNHTLGVPTDIYLPATVTDNHLSFAVRGNRPDSMPGLPVVLPVIEGIEVLPDSSAPHLTIDSQGVKSVMAGSTLQLYSIGWYMPNSVTWNITSGPGSIDANGLYTAPVASISSQWVIIQAASSLPGNRCAATVTLTVTPAQFSPQ
jgi:hypothetical protein